MYKIKNSVRHLVKTKGIESDNKIVMLGTEYDCDHNTTRTEDRWDAFLYDLESRIYLSYRHNFQSVQGFTTDTGWGCMYRTGQMMLAQAFQFFLLGRNWRFTKTHEKELLIYFGIVRWFCDDRLAPYSIHKMMNEGFSLGIKPGEWHSPTSVSNVLSRLVEKSHNDFFKLYVSRDSTVSLSKIESIARSDKQFDHRKILFSTLYDEETNNDLSLIESSKEKVDLEEGITISWDKEIFDTKIVRRQKKNKTFYYILNYLESRTSEIDFEKNQKVLLREKTSKDEVSFLTKSLSTIPIEKDIELPILSKNSIGVTLESDKKKRINKSIKSNHLLHQRSKFSKSPNIDEVSRQVTKEQEMNNVSLVKEKSINKKTKPKKIKNKKSKKTPFESNTNVQETNNKIADNWDCLDDFEIIQNNNDSIKNNKKIKIKKKKKKKIKRVPKKKKKKNFEKNFALVEGWDIVDDFSIETNKHQKSISDKIKKRKKQNKTISHVSGIDKLNKLNDRIQVENQSIKKNNLKKKKKGKKKEGDKKKNIIQKGENNNRNINKTEKKKKNEVNNKVVFKLKKTNSENDKKKYYWIPIIIFIPARLGVEKINPQYIEPLKEVFTFPQTLGIVGGKPNTSLYYIATQDNSLYYLDPHKTQTTIETLNQEVFNTQSYHQNSIYRMKITGMDPSMLFGFLLKNQNDYFDFVQRYKIFENKWKSKCPFFIKM
ncbi:cysteine protease atg4 [Anaeramoeba flamelloides]|uniref:Cysteine protease n=1 Tax=Anaeramoeba flamelloides TaxID=1746091 RepID=A0ABQ8YA16_9EUKA|nr:cysteine protease atg4 [Anaeramoeba flamelloides]